MENKIITELQKLTARVNEHSEELIRLTAEMERGKGVPIRLPAILHYFEFLDDEIQQTVRKTNKAYPPGETDDPMREAIAAAYRDMARAYDKCAIVSDEAIKIIEAGKHEGWAR